MQDRVNGGEVPWQELVWLLEHRVEALLDQGRNEEAEPRLLRSYELLRVQDPSGSKLRSTLERLVEIYENRGEMEKARHNYQRFYEHWKDGDLDRERVAEAKSKI